MHVEVERRRIVDDRLGRRGIDWDGHRLEIARALLHEPEIPNNTGNIGRTCIATGCGLHLIHPLGFSTDEKACRRAGLDYWEHVDPVVHDSFAAFEAELPRLGVPFFMTVEGPGNLFEMEIPDEAVFVFGSESKGLPPAVRDRYRDRLVRLPIVDPRVRSLNLSTAVGVTLYEALRRRR